MTSAGRFWLGYFAALALLAFLLVGCAGSTSVQVPPPPDTSPRSALWQMPDGSWEEYQMLRGRGTYDPVTGCIEPDRASLIADEINRNTNLDYIGAHGPTVARVYSPSGAAVLAVPDKLGASLLERSDSTGRYIGEAGSYAGPDVTEPEPMLTKNPVVGEIFTVHSIATRWDGVTFLFTSRYYTKAVNIEIDGFTGATVTCLTESPDDAPTAYEMVYDGGLAEQWDGVVQPDNSVQIIMARRIATGHN